MLSLFTFTLLHFFTPAILLTPSLPHFFTPVISFTISLFHFLTFSLHFTFSLFHFLTISLNSLLHFGTISLPTGLPLFLSNVTPPPGSGSGSVPSRALTAPRTRHGGLPWARQSINPNRGSGRVRETCLPARRPRRALPHLPPPPPPFAHPLLFPPPPVGQPFRLPVGPRRLLPPPSVPRAHARLFLARARFLFAVLGLSPGVAPPPQVPN